MPKNLPIALLLVPLLLLVPGPASAQVDVPTSPYAVFAMADRQDWVLRVTRLDGAQVEGRVRALDEAEVRLEGGRVLLSTVSRVERGEREGGGGRRGALIGGVVGGVVFGLLLFTVPGDGTDDAAIISIPVIGAGLGAIIGGLIGAALDPADTEWRTVWPAGESR